jgi:hypothetical protein
MLWIARLLLVAAGFIAAIFVARDAPNFGVVEVLVAMLMIFVFIVGAGLWIQRWKIKPPGN